MPSYLFPWRDYFHYFHSGCHRSTAISSLVSYLYKTLVRKSFHGYFNLCLLLIRQRDHISWHLHHHLHHLEHMDKFLDYEDNWVSCAKWTAVWCLKDNTSVTKVWARRLMWVVCDVARQALLQWRCHALLVQYSNIQSGKSCRSQTQAVTETVLILLRDKLNVF